MKDNRIKIITVLMSVSVVGLIVIQFYWISNLIKTEERQFTYSVNEALENIVDHLEEEETKDALLESFDIDVDENVFFVDSTQSKIKEIIVKPISKKHKKTMHYNWQGDSNKSIYKFKVETDVDTNIQVTVSSEETPTEIHKDSLGNISIITGNKPIFIQKKNLVTKVVNKLSSVNRFKKLEDRIKLNDLDTLIKKNLNEKGINTEFIYAVKDNSRDTVISISSKEAFHTIDKADFSAKIFSDDFSSSENYLLLKFPNKNYYLLKSMGIMLVVSLLLIIAVILIFYTTLKMLLKQKRITEIKNDLINNITHEFKTPIATIGIAAEALNEKEISSQQNSVKRYSEIIGQENNRLGILVDNLLNTAQLEKGDYNLKKESLNLNKIIQGECDSFSNIIKKNNGEIILNLDKSIPLLNGDKFHITNIIHNLIDNAIKYSEAETKVIVESKMKNNTLQISVSDNGIGIDKKHIDKIFETFYRVPTGNIHNIKGNGIGLSYVKKMVEAHGGLVKVKSTLGRGSIFKIELPIN